MNKDASAIRFSPWEGVCTKNWLWCPFSLTFWASTVHLNVSKHSQKSSNKFLWPASLAPGICFGCDRGDIPVKAAITAVNTDHVTRSHEQIMHRLAPWPTASGNKTPRCLCSFQFLWWIADSISMSPRTRANQAEVSACGQFYFFWTDIDSEKCYVEFFSENGSVCHPS